MNRRVLPITVVFALSLLDSACKVKPPTENVLGAPTCASIDVGHPGVTIDGRRAVRTGRVESAGRVQTDTLGRAVVRTDDGLELRLAGDTDVVFVDGHPRLDRGRMFVSGHSDDERVLRVGPQALLHLGDAAVEVERDGRGSRVIAVRGDLSYEQGNRQGELSQGESLEGDSTLAVRPAGVWDDWTGGAASPQGMSPRTARGNGRMIAHLTPGEAPSPLALNEQRVSVVVQGDVAITTVDQRFFNGSDRAAPVEYRLRLPDGAILGGFRVEQAGQWLTATPAVVAQGGGGGLPGLVQAPDGEVYASIGTLSPGDTLRAQAVYVEWLSRDGDRRFYTYPIGDVTAPQLIGEFSFDVDLSRARASLVHAPDGARLVDRHLVMRRSDFRPRGDLVVDLADARPETAPTARGWRSAVTGPAGVDHLMVDVTLEAPEATGTDIAIVLDDSAATDSSTLEIARAAVDALLHQLGANDRVALLFGDLAGTAAEGPAGQMAAVTPERREAILDAIAHARPGGASNLGRMLVDAQSTLDPRRNGAVLYLGDATPTVGAIDPERLVDETARQAPELRLYALALGNQSHPEVLAPLTTRGGMIARVTDQAEAVARAVEMSAHAIRPCLREVTVDVGDALAHPLPARVDTWVLGDPLRVLGELVGKAPKEVRVSARVGSELRRWTLPLTVSVVNDHGDLGRRWANARIEALAHTGSGRASIAEIGARYGLVTQVSALVLGVAPGADGSAGFLVNGSAWPVDLSSGTLPELGVARAVGPRGVQSVEAVREVPIAVDDESGWQPHRAGENAGMGGQAALGAALVGADPAARACVERKRALRPGLSGAITVNATIDATGRVTAADVVSSTLGDAETDGCIRRAVLGLSLPPPALFGAGPGVASRSFEFGASVSTGLARGQCASTAQLPRAVRRVLWRERMATLAASSAGATQLWSTAMARCELRWWEDRVALMDLILDWVSDPAELVGFRNGLTEAGAVEYLDSAISRRYGPSRAWMAYNTHPLYIDWSALLERLASPTLTLPQKIQIVRAYLTVAPRDVDLRLRLMALLEQSGDRTEARRMADRLRRDPLADARVRGLVGEFLLRAGNRPEALRAFSEIAEFAPYDPYARGRLGDLLLTYGWPEEAYHQYQTLTALRPGDPLPTVRTALAALAAGREDEALRTLRRASEEVGGGADAVGRTIESMLDVEIARIAAARPDDPAVRSWVRVAGQLGSARDTSVLVRWTHPDVGLELLARAPSDTAFAAVGDAPAAIGLRTWIPESATEGMRFVVRAATGLAGARAIEAKLQVRLPGEHGARWIEAAVQLDRTHRARGFVLRSGALVPEEVAATELSAVVEALY